MTIQIKKLHPDAVIPKRATEGYTWIRFSGHRRRFLGSRRN